MLEQLVGEKTILLWSGFGRDRLVRFRVDSKLTPG